MKLILERLYTEPVIACLAANGVVTALAAEGVINGWIAVVCLAFTAPFLRDKVTPSKRS